MRLARLVLSFLLILSSSPRLNSQQSTPAPGRDPQATAILQSVIRTMGGGVPSDSVATGTVIRVEGSQTESGFARILTRGTDQTSEQIQTQDSARTIVYSRGIAREGNGALTTSLNLQLAVTSQSPDFPLPLLASMLNNSDFAVAYIGLETVEGRTCYHIHTWNTFGSTPSLQELSEFTARDLWIDSTSGLLTKLAFVQRGGTGAVPRIPVTISFSDYRNVDGILYPFQILKSLNGTPWMTISITQIQLNAGLSDADFTVQ